MLGFWRTRRGTRGYCGHSHATLEEAAQCAHLREVRYELLGEPAQVEVLGPKGRPLTLAERGQVGRIMAGLALPRPPAPAPQDNLPRLVVRAVRVALETAAEEAPSLGPRVADLVALALSRLALEADRRAAQAVPRTMRRAPA